LSRLDSATDFLTQLDAVEDELTTPDREVIDDPARAQKRDQLPGGYSVVRRLGRGACAVALLVERDGHEYVLKAALSPEHDRRVRDEADIIGSRLRHPHLLEFCGLLSVGDRPGFLTRAVLVD